MTSLTGQLIQQSGVIPWKRLAGEINILLITSSKSDRWLIPKGHLEPLLPAHESAMVEAFEEAGVLGRVFHDAVGVWQYRKRRADYCVTVFPMEVLDELPRWPEMGKRQRRWLPIDRAMERVDHPHLAQMFLALPAAIELALLGHRRS